MCVSIFLYYDTQSCLSILYESQNDMCLMFVALWYTNLFVNIIWNSEVSAKLHLEKEQGTFNPLVGSSSFLRPTREINELGEFCKTPIFYFSPNLSKSNLLCDQSASRSSKLEFTLWLESWLPAWKIIEKALFCHFKTFLTGFNPFKTD
jgi:hypothetical protein